MRVGSIGGWRQQVLLLLTVAVAATIVTVVRPAAAAAPKVCWQTTGQFVDVGYQITLLRNPTPTERKTAIDRLNAKPYGQRRAAEAILFGTELFQDQQYRDRVRANRQFIYDQYRLWYHRDATAAEVAQWFPRLQNSDITRAKVREVISEGPPFTTEFGSRLCSLVDLAGAPLPPTYVPPATLPPGPSGDGQEDLDSVVVINYGIGGRRVACALAVTDKGDGGEIEEFFDALGLAQPGLYSMDAAESAELDDTLLDDLDDNELTEDAYEPLDDAARAAAAGALNVPVDVDFEDDADEAINGVCLRRS